MYCIILDGEPAAIDLLKQYLQQTGKVKVLAAFAGTFDMNAFINLKSGKQIHHVKLGDILFLEKQGNYFAVLTEHKKILIRASMEEVLEQLPPALFIKVHKSYIVSRLHIDIIESHQLHIRQHIIPVAQAHREALKLFLNGDKR